MNKNEEKCNCRNKYQNQISQAINLVEAQQNLHQILRELRALRQLKAALLLCHFFIRSAL